ncbi:MAG: Hsp70 family protein [Nitrospinae bacterium]|nr:Hsp70 family protein [Nitrospinota bacterium]
MNESILFLTFTAAYEEEDKTKKEKIDTHNRLDSAIYSTEKTLTDNKDKISEEDAKKLQEALDEAKKALETDDLEAMKAAEEKLNAEAHRIASLLYQNTNPAGGQGQPFGEGFPGAENTQGQADSAGSNDNKDEDIVDAEFEEKK